MHSTVTDFYFIKKIKVWLIYYFINNVLISAVPKSDSVTDFWIGVITPVRESSPYSFQDPANHKKTHYHRILVKYFQRQTDFWRVYQELPWHLKMSGCWEDLSSFLSSPRWVSSFWCYVWQISLFLLLSPALRYHDALEQDTPIHTYSFNTSSFIQMGPSFDLSVAYGSLGLPHLSLQKVLFLSQLPWISLKVKRLPGRGGPGVDQGWMKPRPHSPAGPSCLLPLFLTFSSPPSYFLPSLPFLLVSLAHSF